jgi:hypothetical protein
MQFQWLAGVWLLYCLGIALGSVQPHSNLIVKNFLVPNLVTSLLV